MTQCTITQCIIYSQSRNNNTSLFINLTNIIGRFNGSSNLNVIQQVHFIAIIVDYGFGHGYYLDDFLVPINLLTCLQHMSIIMIIVNYEYIIPVTACVLTGV